jgi:hypothetical protein
MKQELGLEASSFKSSQWGGVQLPSAFLGGVHQYTVIVFSRRDAQFFAIARNNGNGCTEHLLHVRLSLTTT